MANEVWLDIPGYEGLYQVSDMGGVHSLDRWRRSKSDSRRLVPGRVRAQRLSAAGYPIVDLTDQEHKRKTWLVHRLVMLAFIGPPQPGTMARHLNGNPGDPRVENLAYGTGTENQLDRLVHGTHTQANRTHCPYGHPYSGDNLVWTRQNTRRPIRRCRICINRRQRERYARRSERGSNS